MDDIASAFPIINNRYKLINIIATGGMATIYRAKDVTLDRNVAIKLLNKALSGKDTLRIQFETEAKSSAKLLHPNIVATYDFGSFQDRLFIAMELIEGYHLKNLLSNNKLSSYEEKHNLILQACQGLGYAHDKGIIHCDLKPQNMLVSKKGTLKLTDFGISRTIGSISRYEEQGSVWGSPYYISPEVAAGRPPTPESDVYSMGIVMYEVYTDLLPFQGEDAISIVEKHQNQQPLSPSALKYDLPIDLEEIILKALRKIPKYRYCDGNSLLTALKNVTNILINPDAKLITMPNSKVEEQTMRENLLNTQGKEMNWVTIIFSFLAIIAIGGLIPFWLFVYYSINR